VKKVKAAPKKAVPKGAKKGDPVELILAKMGEMYQIGMTEVKESILLEATGYARHDSNGYRNAVKQVTKELGYVGKEKKIYKLTESGIDYLLESGTIVIPEEPKNTEEHHAQLLGTLKLVKAPKVKLEAIFELLADGKWHSIDSLLAASEYNRTDSNGYRNIMSGLKNLDLLEKKGKNFRFSDKAFKFGRPWELR